MLRVPNVPLLRKSTSSTPNVGPFYPSVRTNVVGRDGLEGMTDNRAHQYTTTSGLAVSAQIEPDRDLILQKLNDLTANINAQLREWHDLHHKLQYARAQHRDHTSFTTTTTPYVPSTITSPHSTIDIPPLSFSQTANLSASQGETWNIPHLSSPSQVSSAQYTQPATHPPPKRTVRNRPGKNFFRCECGHEASRKGDMNRHRESLGHAQKGHVCYCGKSYTRRDSLLRHATTHDHTPIFLDSIPY